MKAFVNLLIEEDIIASAGDIEDHIKDLLSAAGVKILWSKSKEAEDRNDRGTGKSNSPEPF